MPNNRRGRMAKGLQVVGCPHSTDEAMNKINSGGKADYEVDLDKNLDELVEKLKRRAYKPQPARRTEIRKPNGKMRPLSIYCYEDKLVQEALRRILDAELFYERLKKRMGHFGLSLEEENQQEEIQPQKQRSSQIDRRDENTACESDCEEYKSNPC
jgi:hypothetical protein